MVTDVCVGACGKCARLELYWDNCPHAQCNVENEALGRCWMNKVHGKPLPPVVVPDERYEIWEGGVHYRQIDAGLRYLATLGGKPLTGWELIYLFSAMRKCEGEE